MAVYGDGRNSEFTRFAVRPGQVLYAPRLMALVKVTKGGIPVAAWRYWMRSLVGRSVYAPAAVGRGVGIAEVGVCNGNLIM